MTPLDLRIKYKFETGYSPTYGKDSQEYYNYRGALTHFYAIWLEGNSSYASMKRYTYFRETGNHATYYDYYRYIHYTKEYKEWLEEAKCETYSILEKLRK
jgi:hypothetical protein